MPRLRVTEMDHINQLIDGTDKAVAHYRDLYGAQIEEVYRQRFGPYDNFVFKMGAMTMEVFSPVDPQHSFGRQHQRFGNCWQACLWRVPNLEEAIETCRSEGIPLVDVEMDPDRRWAFTDPRTTFFSIQLEDRDTWDKTVTPNPVGILGMAGFSVAVPDRDQAVALFRGLVADADVLYEEERPGLAAVATAIGVDRYAVEFVSPTGEGEISAFLERYRARIRTVTWKVSSLEKAAKHFADHGISLRPGDRPAELAIAPEDNLGVPMQFSE